jgi:small subunit ribosomal protein S8
MITDPIGDMLTRIRNANTALHETVAMPTSGMKREIARILQEEGYIDAWNVSKGETHDTLVVTLRYGPSRERVISGLKRISKPGRRVFAKKDRPHRVLGGMGIAILSTSKGVLTGRHAQEQDVGGEVLCYVW